ncbi:hypothetical protein STANM309S_01326 [Streptomyces tanashiensis]
MPAPGTTARAASWPVPAAGLSSTVETAAPGASRSRVAPVTYTVASGWSEPGRAAAPFTVVSRVPEAVSAGRRERAIASPSLSVRAAPTPSASGLSPAGSAAATTVFRPSTVRVAVRTGVTVSPRSARSAAIASAGTRAASVSRAKTAGIRSASMLSRPPRAAPIAVTAETATVTPTSIAEEAAAVRRALARSCCTDSLPTVPNGRRSASPSSPTSGGNRCWAYRSTPKNETIAPSVTASRESAEPPKAPRARSPAPATSISADTASRTARLPGSGSFAEPLAASAATGGTAAAARAGLRTAHRVSSTPNAPARPKVQGPGRRETSIGPRPAKPLITAVPSAQAAAPAASPAAEARVPSMRPWRRMIRRS